MLTARPVFAAALVALAWFGRSEAQSPPSRALMVAAGLSAFGTRGEAPIGGSLLAARVALQYRPGLMIEPGLAYADYSPLSTAYLLPEITVQLIVPAGWFRPYVGAGVGLAAAVRGSDPSGPTLHLAGGIRIRASSAWSLGPDVRWRLQPGQEDTGWIDVLLAVARQI